MSISIDKLLKHIDSLYLEKKHVINDNSISEEINDNIDNNKICIFDNLNYNIQSLEQTILESVLDCVDKDFLGLDFKTKKECIMHVKDKEYEQYQKLYTEKNYKRFFMKKKLRETLKDNSLNEDIYKLYLSDFFSINIVVIENNKFYFYFSEEKFNKYKPLCMLLKKNNKYSSVIFNKKKLFYSTDRIVKHFLQKDNWNNFIVVNYNKNVREFDIGIESLDNYLKRYCIINTNDLKEKSESSNSDTKNSNDKKNNLNDENAFDEPTIDEQNNQKLVDTEFDDGETSNNENYETDGVFIKKVQKDTTESSINSETELNNLIKEDFSDIKVSIKMKKTELVNIAEKLKIKLTNGKKQKTKQELCEDINNILLN